MLIATRQELDHRYIVVPLYVNRFAIDSVFWPKISFLHNALAEYYMV